MIMCEPDPARLPVRDILDFNKDEVFRAGRVHEMDGDTWLELAARVPARSVRISPN